MLKNLVDNIWKKPLYQYIFFTLAAVISIALMGYYFGTFDQVSHIPFLKKTADPSLYPNDPFFELRKTHYSYFWLFFIPFLRLHILEIVMFVVYFASIYMTFWVLWRLSKTIFNNAWTSFLTIIIFTFPHLSFGMFSIIEFSLLNRTFVLPFLLLSIDFYLKRKYIWAFLILGLMYNLHIISVNFILLMFLVDLVIQFRRVGLKKIFLSIFVFILFALPVLIWKFGHSSLDLSVQREWFSIINRSILYHLFNLISSNFKITYLTFGVIGSIPLFFIAGHYISSKYDRIITNFIYVLIFITLVAAVTGYMLPITIIIQSQIIRGGIFIVVFSYMYFANYLVKSHQKKELRGVNFSLILISTIFSLLPTILLIFWILNKKIFSKLSRAWSKNLSLLSIIVLTIVFITQAFLIYNLKIWQPGIHVFAEKSSYYDVEIWARDNTLKDAIFITPPYSWWFYNLEWRVESERSTVVVLSDLLEAAFDPSYIKIWRPRFEDVAPGALARFKGDYFENIKITSNAYYSMSTDKIMQLSRKYNASYFVVEKPHQYNLPVVYENKGYVVYDINNNLR